MKALSFHLLAAGHGSARLLEPVDTSLLQRFLDANPEYFLATSDAAATPETARRLIDDQPPEGWAFDQHLCIGFFEASGALIGVALCTKDLFAAGIWHIGLFLLASELHGRGIGTAHYRALERWLEHSGARWIRLGVVVGHRKAEVFWQRHGFVQVRTRAGVRMEQRINDVRVMVKTLKGESLDQYLELVERDRMD